MKTINRIRIALDLRARWRFTWAAAWEYSRGAA
jgi:hypothetical protein